MGKRSSKTPWRLVAREGTQNLEVHFSHGGKRYRFGTGCSDAATAATEAARIYADIVSGKPQARKIQRPVGRVAVEGLEVLFATWLVSLDGTLDHRTIDSYALYCKAHFLPFFRSLSEITTPRAADYVRLRLGKVTAKSVKKELSALRGFLAWAHERGHIEDPVAVRPVAKRAVGTPDPRAKVGGWVGLTEREAQRILTCLPERGRQGHPVKAYYSVLWESGLRPETLCSILVPRDFKPGANTLTIQDEADKARFGRTVPLTPTASEALGSVAPEAGHIFPRGRDGRPKSYREILRTAAKAAGLEPARAGRISDYDFRHGRITHIVAETGDLLGAGYLAGHKHASTTALYAHARQAHATKTLEKLGAKRDEK